MLRIALTKEQIVTYARMLAAIIILNITFINSYSEIIIMLLNSFDRRGLTHTSLHTNISKGFNYMISYSHTRNAYDH